MSHIRTQRTAPEVVSFHPLFKADRNIICAGRDPDSSDLIAIRAAKAVILPQGCSRRLYEMARFNCANVFPNYDARFHYAGKVGQTKLFRETGTFHPQTAIFCSADEFSRRFPHCEDLDFPLVFKFDWGGEGDTVFLVRSPEELKDRLENASRFEASGQNGFIIQQFIESGNRSLRVVVIGTTLISYWRTQESATCFHTCIAKGAKVDHTSSPALKKVAEQAVAKLCSQVGINLAGFDLIFDQKKAMPRPLMLEINYFFGRAGLGGSEVYYRIVRQEIRRWLKMTGVRYRGNRGISDADPEDQIRL